MNRFATRLLRRLERFHREHPWSHNDAYHRWVVRQARAVRRGGGRSALDVGCGTGNLVRRLAAVMSEVTGIEPDPATAALARANVAGLPHGVIREGAFDDCTDAAYGLVTFVAVLHHLPLTPTLRAARAMIRPGGRLVVVGVSREDRGDRWRSLVSVILNPIVGIVRHPRRAEAVPVAMTAPVADAAETFDEISAAMCRELPGVTVRRALFWRYTAVWVAPLTPDPHVERQLAETHRRSMT